MSRLTLPALVAGLLSLASLACASAALAGTPATVTVRVEGLTETKVPPTLVTTTTNPVIEKGHLQSESCSGTSALGALDLATAGNWSGPWEASYKQYAIYTIEGETHEFAAGSNANYYWAFWLDDRESEIGACEAELQPGDRALFFPACYGSECPTPPPTPLEIEAPATADTKEAVNVTVKQYNAKGEPSPVDGANVGGGGTSATTDAQGHATLRFFGGGTYTLRASGAEGSNAVRTETAICVHEGNDGTCGTTAMPSGPSFPAPASSMPQQTPYKGPYAVVADVTAPLDNHAYARARAPRELAGKVIAHAAVASIEIRLRRTFKGRCWAYNGARERLARVRCRRGGFFKVGSGGTSFSLLLPSKLPPGRYVLDMRASDAYGNVSPLDRGASRVVFYVR